MDTNTNTHSITLGGETQFCNIDTFQAVSGALVEKYGPSAGIPAVLKLKTAPEPTAAEASLPMPEPEQFDPDGISETGKARAERDEAMARANDFDPEPPIYSIGTRVNSIGMENVRASQEEHDAKPLAVDACRSIAQRVREEERRDIDGVALSTLRMSKQGDLVTPDNGRLALNKRGFQQMFGRFPCASGSNYLADCTPKLRAINFNHWAMDMREQPAVEMKIRTRKSMGAGPSRTAYAVVGPNYPTFDADKIATALEQAFPADTRAVADYDGLRLRVEGIWHSDVKPVEYVAGEIFKAVVLVRSDDGGGGSVHVQSAIWRNLCRNLYILDKAIGVDIRLQHKGSVEKLAAQFRQAFAKALNSVEGFRHAWGYAMNERGAELVARVQGTTSDDLGPLPVEAVLPGIFNALVTRELVPVRGRAKAVVPQLLEMHRQDEAADAYGVSRASIVNAFTRYAHQVETDPFVADEIREGASRLLSNSRGRAPSPLPYLAFGA